MTSSPDPAKPRLAKPRLAKSWPAKSWPAAPGPAGRRIAVLITRPEPGGVETADRVRALGFRPVLAPLLRIRRLAITLPPSATVQAVLATSSNAVPSLVASLHGLKLLAVGDATARRAVAAGFTNVLSAGGTARDLADLAAATLAPAAGPVLLACGKGHGLELAAALRRRGFRVRRRAVYAAEGVAALPLAAVDALTDDSLRAALFFSADTARHFVRLLTDAGLRQKLPGIVALAISPAAGVALEGLPWRSIAVARHPTQEELLALLR